MNKSIKILKENLTKFLNENDADVESSQSAESYKTSGLKKFQLKDWRGALEDLTKVIEMVKMGHTVNKVSIVYENRGRVKFQLKDYRGALEDFEESIKKNINASVYDGDIARSHYCIGVVKTELKDWSGALENFDKATTINPFLYMNSDIKELIKTCKEHINLKSKLTEK